jgi:hypothetical protein
MKTSVFIFISVLLWSSLQAQYSMNTTFSTYQELTNPVSVNNGNVWNSGSDYTIFFNFNFYIYDQNYTALSVRGGGGLNFPGDGVKELFVFHTPFGGYMLRDKGTTNSLSSIDYEISGDTGQQVLKIQWENAGFEQWYTSSDISDFVDFQIWVFESDNHIEIHFGNHQADPGTYGYPEATNDPNPGPSIKFKFDTCSNIFALTGPCDLPSYWFMDACQPNYSFIDGTPSNGITYNIYPTNVGLTEKYTEKITLFPNPASDWCVVNLSPSVNNINLLITNALGLELVRINNIKNEERINLSKIQSGLYLYKVIQGNSIISKGKLIKLK